MTFTVCLIILTMRRFHHDELHLPWPGATGVRGNAPAAPVGPRQTRGGGGGGGGGGGVGGEEGTYALRQPPPRRPTVIIPNMSGLIPPAFAAVKLEVRLVVFLYVNMEILPEWLNNSR